MPKWLTWFLAIFAAASVGAAVGAALDRAFFTRSYPAIIAGLTVMDFIYNLMPQGTAYVHDPDCPTTAADCHAYFNNQNAMISGLAEGNGTTPPPVMWEVNVIQLAADQNGLDAFRSGAVAVIHRLDPSLDATADAFIQVVTNPNGPAPGSLLPGRAGKYTFDYAALNRWQMVGHSKRY
jgi:hypothetical protein